ncbi:MAG: SdpI family protein [Oscillospiraceae bacterium]
MAIWVFALIVDLIIPFSMIGFGRLFLKGAPVEINSIFGYRTKRSMQNHETWTYAHRFCGKLWFIMGWVILAVTLIVMIPLLGRGNSSVAIGGGILCAAQLICLIVSIFPTQLSLKHHFNEAGERIK